ncbi:MAG: RNase P subunit p30 family protein [Candidatus Aenigmarchaeota archaeon]|nr:RNase P subunit p30 family protein [Candidatus Aenigmarchaeota archaeon]
MKFYDLHVYSSFANGQPTLEQLAQTAKELDYHGICYVVYFEGKEREKIVETQIKEVSRKIGIEILLGLKARNVKELNFLAGLRRDFDLLLVKGGNLDLNRAAVETPEVDILAHPELGRLDSGFNHVLAKLAAKNNVAIEMNFREILTSSKRSRSLILAHMRENVKLAKKYHVPIVLCSGAISNWELRDPQVIIFMANQLGLELKEAKECISTIPENIINRARERRDEKFIMPGVRVVK